MASGPLEPAGPVAVVHMVLGTQSDLPGGASGLFQNRAQTVMALTGVCASVSGSAVGREDGGPACLLWDALRSLRPFPEQGPDRDGPHWGMCICVRFCCWVRGWRPSSLAVGCSVNQAGTRASQAAPEPGLVDQGS